MVYEQEHKASSKSAPHRKGYELAVGKIEAAKAGLLAAGGKERCKRQTADLQLVVLHWLPDRSCHIPQELCVKVSRLMVAGQKIVFNPDCRANRPDRIGIAIFTGSKEPTPFLFVDHYSKINETIWDTGSLYRQKQDLISYPRSTTWYPFLALHPCF